MLILSEYSVPIFFQNGLSAKGAEKKLKSPVFTCAARRWTTDLCRALVLMEETGVASRMMMRSALKPFAADIVRRKENARQIECAHILPPFPALHTADLVSSRLYSRQSRMIL